MKDQLKPRDKITQKMSRDGLIEVNETKETAECVSKREQQAAQDAAQLQGVPSDVAPLPHAPGFTPKQDAAATERVMEHLDAVQTRKASKKAARKAQQEATAQTKTSRLQFTDEERATPELEKYIKKSDKAADRLDAAKAAIPKKKTLPPNAPLTKPQARAKPVCALRKRKNPYRAAKSILTPCRAPHRKPGLPFTTRYIPLKRTIPAWRERTKPRS